MNLKREAVLGLIQHARGIIVEVISGLHTELSKEEISKLNNGLKALLELPEPQK